MIAITDDQGNEIKHSAHEWASMLAQLGLSVIPVGEDKTPRISSWAKHQTRQPTSKELSNYFSNGTTGFAVVCGKVSGNLETLDFDNKNDNCVFEDWFQTLKDMDAELAARLYVTSTPSAGFHVRYRCPDVIIKGNRKLAVVGDDTLIETRGQGGYALCPPSAGYSKHQGSVSEIPLLQPSEHKLLIDLCRSFGAPPEPKSTQPASITGDRPGDHYNQSPDVESQTTDLLIKNGWELVAERGDRIFWKRPGSSNKWSANYSKEHKIFYCFSSDATPFEPDQGYNPFAVLSFLAFGRYFADAARSLAAVTPAPRSDMSVVQAEVPPVTDNQVETEADDGSLKDWDMSELSTLIPPNSWLEKYIEYVYPTVDSPSQFTLACGLSVLSMAIRDSHIPFGTFRIRPNLWIAIVAPSSIYRKSTSIRIARQFLNELEPGVVLPDQMSPEAFISYLAEENGFGLFHWSEMASQLLSFEKSYMAEYKSLLTELYDCPHQFTRMTKADGLVEIDNPFINILCASTQKWLNDCLSEGNLKGGFLPRFIYIQASSKDRFVGFPQAPDQGLKHKLLDKLTLMAQSFNGPIQVDPKAIDLYSDQAKQLEQASMGSEHEGIVGAFYSRLSNYLLKFGLIYQAMMDHTQTEISLEAMQYSVRLCQYLRQNIDLVMDRITYSPDMAERQKLIELIRAEPGISRSRLLRKSRLSVKRMNDGLDTLVQAYQVHAKKSVPASKGAPVTQYFMVKG